MSSLTNYAPKLLTPPFHLIDDAEHMKNVLRVAALALLALCSANNLASAQPAPVQSDYLGTLASDGNSLAGTWTQANATPPPTPMNCARQAQRVGPAATSPATYVPAMAPVSAADMESVLRRDLEKTSSTGLLAPGKPTGIAVGVVRNGERRIFTFGTAKANSIFEIGSITKTFTGLMLAQMIEQGAVRPDTPVRELLPKGNVEKPRGAEISLRDLVTQHSGLPRLPDNMKPADPNNPYADYGAGNLYQFLGKQGVAKPDKPAFLYSNLGFGLLGQALANHAEARYPELLERLVLEPLELSDTAVDLSPDQKKRFISGYSAALQPAHSWEADSFAGATAIRSTADDMLRYLEAHLAPQKFAGSMPAALAASHVPLADVGPDKRIAYAWVFETKTGSYWHNGGTGGFSSYAFFNPEARYAAVVLVNVTVGGRGSFADQLGQHIAERFAGKPAISLERW